jgi:hypothetical protein
VNDIDRDLDRDITILHTLGTLAGLCQCRLADFLR